MSPVGMLKLYGLTALVFFAIDLVWLGVVAAGLVMLTDGAVVSNVMLSLTPEETLPAASL